MAVDIEAGSRFKHRGGASCPWDLGICHNLFCPFLSAVPRAVRPAATCTGNVPVTSSAHLICSLFPHCSASPTSSSSSPSPWASVSFPRKPGQGRRPSDLYWQLNHVASHLGVGWWLGRGRRRGWGSPKQALRDFRNSSPTAYLRVASAGAVWWLSWALATVWPCMSTSAV